jgi:UDP-3-O-[3-hydroxymyristoyl] glucosamine N-acyltransferase
MDNKVNMVTVQQIIDLIQPERVILHHDTIITTPVQLDANDGRDDVIMWASAKNQTKLKFVQCGTIICPNIDPSDISEKCNYLISSNPRHAFQLVLTHYFAPKVEYTVAKSAKIHPTAKLSSDIFIGENVVIESGVEIASNTIIGHNTVIHSNTKIHQYVTIGNNCVIGGVGFGYEKDENGQYVLLPHIGNVVLEEHVEIGNCTTIDRAVMGSTRLSKNVKVDNLVHIAHGVQIGENSLIIANAMIGGSTIIGENVWIAPSSSLINKIEVGNNVVVGMGAVVLKSAPDSSVIIGNPGKPLEKK